MKNFMFIQLCFLLLGCPLAMDEVYRIWIKNNSNYRIYMYIPENYSDTLIPKTKSELNKINSKSAQTIDSSEPWDDSFSKEFPKDTMVIFFFHADTIAKYDWETIRKGYKILERRAYSKQDLKNRNWTITYP